MDDDTDKWNYGMTESEVKEYLELRERRYLKYFSQTTKCPKIGAAQWTCSFEECVCRVKPDIGRRLALQGKCPCPDGCNGCEYLEPTKRRVDSG